MVLQYTVSMAFEKKIGKKYLIGNLQNICLDLESIMLKFPQEAKVVNCNLFLFSCGCVLPLICSQATAGICGTRYNLCVASCWSCFTQTSNVSASLCQKHQ